MSRGEGEREGVAGVVPLSWVREWECEREHERHWSLMATVATISGGRAGRRDAHSSGDPVMVLTCVRKGTVGPLAAEPDLVLNFELSIQNWFELPKSKIENGTFSSSKNHGNFKSDILAQDEKLSQLVKHPIQNRMLNTISTSFWYLNFLWILKGFKPLG
jgi:hypothetical protein